MDVETLRLVGGGIHLSDHETLNVAELFSEFLPSLRHRLAVSAPGSVELNENLILCLKDFLSEILADNGLQGPTVFLGDLLRFDVRLELPLLEVGDELLDGLCGGIARAH